MKLTVRPLTPDLWPQLEELFGHRSGVSGRTVSFMRPSFAQIHPASTACGSTQPPHCG